jgi:hypothetical protein
MFCAGLEDSVLKFVVDNIDEIVKIVDGVKNVVVLTIKNRTMQGSAVSVMVTAVLEDSVLLFVVDNSDGIVKIVDGVKNVVVMSIENGNMLVSGVIVKVIAGLKIRF